MKRFASDRVTGLMERMGLEGDVAIESRLVSRTIENAQSRVEGYNFDIRKRVVEYDDVINKQRETIYAERDKVLRNEDLTETVRDFVDAEIEALVDAAPGRTASTTGTSTAWPASSARWASTGDDLDADGAGRDRRARGHPRAPATRPSTRRSRSASRSSARRSGRRSSGWSCCAPSTRCGSTT